MSLCNMYVYHSNCWGNVLKTQPVILNPKRNFGILKFMTTTETQIGYLFFIINLWVITRDYNLEEMPSYSKLGQWATHSPIDVLMISDQFLWLNVRFTSTGKGTKNFRLWMKQLYTRAHISYIKDDVLFLKLKEMMISQLKNVIPQLSLRV